MNVQPTSFLAGKILLADTLQCGQAFRWVRDGDWHCGVSGHRVVWLRQVEGGIEWKCLPPTQNSRFLTHYLSLSDPLGKIVASFPDDPYFRETVLRYRGMRMLRQDPWETLVSFIASSTKQIVQIRQVVANLCERFGDEIADADGEKFFSFPSVANLASASHEQLWNCKLGFRAKYLLATARRIDSGELDLNALAKMETAGVRTELMKCDGVGEKIANCVLLFGYGRHEACPIDVWVGRAIRQLYLQRKRNLTMQRVKEFAENYFGPNAGYAQQYLFHYVRMNPEVLNRQERQEKN